MKVSIKMKFQNSILAEILMKTSPHPLIYDSNNSFWGCGKYGRGNNELGKILIETRTALIKKRDEIRKSKNEKLIKYC